MPRDADSQHFYAMCPVILIVDVGNDELWYSRQGGRRGRPCTAVMDYRRDSWKELAVIDIAYDHAIRWRIGQRQTGPPLRNQGAPTDCSGGLYEDSDGG